MKTLFNQVIEEKIVENWTNENLRTCFSVLTTIINILSCLSPYARKLTCFYLLLYNMSLSIILGLIPWDDDLDICILEENEDKLVTTVRKAFGK